MVSLVALLLAETVETPSLLQSPWGSFDEQNIPASVLA
jgi:hypothetical protein